MSIEKIFEYQDEDGDTIRIRSWESESVHPPSLILHSSPGGYDSMETVSIRLYPEEVVKLAEALVDWYVSLGDDITPRPKIARVTVPERCTVCESAYGRQCVKSEGHRDEHEYDQGDVKIHVISQGCQVQGDQPLAKPEPTHVDPGLRLEALRLAVQNPLAMTAREAVSRAREFEAYLRGEE